MSFHGVPAFSEDTPLFFWCREKNAHICRMTSGLTFVLFFRFVARCTPDPIPSLEASEGVKPPLSEGLAYATVGVFTSGHCGFDVAGLVYR